MRKRSKLLAGMLTASIALSPAVAYASTEEAIKMSWSGENYTSEIGESFVGMPVAVPGDSAERTLNILNDGPGTGELRVSIVNVELESPDAPDKGNFYDDVVINAQDKSLTLRELDDNGTTVIGTQILDKGEETDITIGFGFPVDSVSGNTAYTADKEASFDVLLEMGEQLPDESDPTQTPTDEPPEDDGENDNDRDKDRDDLKNDDNNRGDRGDNDNSSSPDDDDSPLKQLPRTGAEILLAIIVSGALITIGALFMRAAGEKD